MNIIHRMHNTQTSTRWLFAIGWTIIFTILLVIPTSILRIQSSMISVTDIAAILVHVIGFTLFTIFWLWTLSRHMTMRNTIIITLLLAVSFAVGTEWLQTQLPERTGDVADVVADAVGIIIGIRIFRSQFEQREIAKPS